MEESDTRILTLGIKSYKWTAHSFTKREIPPPQRIKDKLGDDIIWPWSTQRLMNEGAALELISRETTIPVPRVIGYGKDEDGVAYLEVERVFGIQCEDVGKQCRMPKAQAHNRSGECKDCAKIAFEKVDLFITTVVLPQLRRLKSTVTGLNGFVIPPPRVLQYDTRLEWKPKTSTKAEYVFCHCDLARHNIMLSPETLEVLCIYDWEHAGFFPQVFEEPMWRLQHEDYIKLFGDINKIQELIALIDA
jgi:hypothetical protein